MRKIAARLKQKNLATKSDIEYFVKRQILIKLKNLNKRVTSNKAKHTEVEKRKTTDLTNKVA